MEDNIDLRLFRFFMIGLVMLTFGCSTEMDQQLDEQPIAELELELDQALDLMDAKPEEALAVLDGVVDRADKLEDNLYIAKAKWYQAYIYDEVLEDVSKAYFTYNEAIKVADQTEDAVLKMKLRTNLGLLYRFYGQYDAAISTYEQVLKDESQLDEKQLSDLYYNIGVALKLSGGEENFLNAEAAFTKALDLAKSIDDHRNIASINNQIGLMYKALGDYDMARIAYDNTISTYISDDEMQEYVGKAYHGIGVTFMDQENYEAAVGAFKKALEHKRNSGSIFVTLYDLGTVQQRKGETTAAIDTWKKAMDEKHSRNDREQVQIYADITNALASQSNYEEALGYATIFNDNVNDILAQDEIYKVENDKILFADIVKEYDQFNQYTAWYEKPLGVVFMGIFLSSMIYLITFMYYRSKASRKVADTMSKIRTEFHHIKVD